MEVEEFKKDKAKLEQSLFNAQRQLFHIEGALFYVNENIKKKEVEDDTIKLND